MLSGGSMFHTRPKDRPSPYRSYIQGLVHSNPHLEIVLQFMSEEEWQRWADHGHPKWQGLEKFDVVVVDITAGDGALADSGPLKSVEEVEAHIDANPLPNKDSLRLFLAEDLSAVMMEYFGAKFMLDPNLFE